MTFKRGILVQAADAVEATEIAREDAVEGTPLRFRIWSVAVESKGDGWFSCVVTMSRK